MLGRILSGLAILAFVWSVLEVFFFTLGLLPISFHYMLSAWGL